MPYEYKTIKLEEGQKLVDILNEHRKDDWLYDHESTSHPSVSDDEIIVYKYTDSESRYSRLDNWALDIFYANKEKGFWPEDHKPGISQDSRNFGEVIALIHSELSEALEEQRKGKEAYYDVDGKPEGWGVELADALIRILDYAGGTDLELGMMVQNKLEYNKTREHKHGKEF